jgi:hypothetical protein
VHELRAERLALLGHGLQLALPSCAQHQPAALLGVLVGELLTDATRCARDDDSPACRPTVNAIESDLLFGIDGAKRPQGYPWLPTREDDRCCATA